jgi:fatty-acyl-CoA synthase
VVGVPDDRFGEKVTAVLSLADGHGLDETALNDHVHRILADYKSPRAFLVVDDVPRAANGKPGYKDAKNLALKMLDMVAA